MTAPEGRTIRVLIVDDEPLARRRLEDLLAGEPGVEIAGTADNGIRAIDAIEALKPDLVFLDVQMPGKTGLEVAREIGPDRMPPTIFVTAFDQHALAAFDLAAIDYLVKPFDDDRFEQSFRRARNAIQLGDVGRLAGQLRALLGNSAGAASAAPSQGYLERIPVDMHGQVRIVPVKQVDYILASGVYAEIHAGDKQYLVRETMQTMEERLDPAKFVRVHRSAIVRLDLIETLHRGGGGDYSVQLRGGPRLKVSRSRFEVLEARMGMRRAKD